MRRKSWFPYLLLLAILIPLCSPFISLTPAHAEGLNFGNSTVLPYKDPKDQSTKRYAVGFMSYDIWSNSSGAWTTKAPGDNINEDDLNWNYSFTFPGRTVRNLEVKQFTSSIKYGEYFNKSRLTDAYEVSYPLFFQ